jgi:hypothetical protein
MKPNFFVNVPKQIFTCRTNFPGSLRLPNPFELPTNEAGEIIFSFARKMITSNVYPIDTPVDNFPLSGIEGVICRIIVM